MKESSATRNHSDNAELQRSRGEEANHHCLHFSTQNLKAPKTWARVRGLSLGNSHTTGVPDWTSQNSHICGETWKWPKAVGFHPTGQSEYRQMQVCRAASTEHLVILQRSNGFLLTESIESVSWAFYPAHERREPDQNSWNRSNTCKSWEVRGPRAVRSRCPIQATGRNVQKQKLDSNLMWVMEVGSQAEGLLVHR